MHILDIILGVFLLVLALWGLKKGFIASIIQLLGLIIAIVIISKMGHFVKEWLISRFDLNEILAVIASYILIFLVIMITVRIIIFLMHSFVELLHLKWLNRLLGALFSVINGLLVISILTIIFNISPFDKEIAKFTEQSHIMKVVRSITNILEKNYPNIDKITDPIKEKIDTTVNKGKEEVINKTGELIQEKAEETVDKISN